MVVMLAPTTSGELSEKPYIKGTPPKNAPNALPILKDAWLIAAPNISEPLEILITSICIGAPKVKATAPVINTMHNEII